MMTLCTSARISVVSGVPLLAWASLAVPGHTRPDEPALNGIYTAISDGQWAKTDERYHDETTIISTWTVSSSCEGVFDCSGRVISDSGWSATARYVSGVWFVTKTIDNWEHCSDGSTAPGHQMFKFFPDPHGDAKLVGWDTTTGRSGACGRNRPLQIEMPFTLVRK